MTNWKGNTDENRGWKSWHKQGWKSIEVRCTISPKGPVLVVQQGSGQVFLLKAEPSSSARNGQYQLD